MCSAILLIDDFPSVREVLRIALESEGYSMIEAADGREDVRLYRDHRPGLVIADIVMAEKHRIPGVQISCSIARGTTKVVTPFPTLNESP